MEPFLTTLLMRAHNAQINALRPGMADVGLSPGQPKILDMLVLHGSQSQRELADRCAIEPATVSRLLDKMEADGLIARQCAPCCRRAWEVSVTDLGRERQEMFQAMRAQVEQRELAGFSPEEETLLRSFLTRLYHNLTTQAKEGPSHGQP